MSEVQHIASSSLELTRNLWALITCDDNGDSSEMGFSTTVKFFTHHDRGTESCGSIEGCPTSESLHKLAELFDKVEKLAIATKKAQIEKQEEKQEEKQAKLEWKERFLKSCDEAERRLEQCRENLRKDVEDCRKLVQGTMGKI